MRRNVSISRNRTKIERLLDWKEFPSKSVGRFSFKCLTDKVTLFKPSIYVSSYGTELMFSFVVWFNMSGDRSHFFVYKVLIY